MSDVPGFNQHGEGRTSHCSFFTWRPVGKTSGEVIAKIVFRLATPLARLASLSQSEMQITNETLSDQKRRSYGPV
jgi:hypothetical protein